MATGAVKVLLEYGSRLYVQHPAWSPDSWNQLFQGGGYEDTTDLYQVPSSGGKPVRLGNALQEVAPARGG